MSHAGPFIILEHFKPRYPLPAGSHHCSRSPGPPPGYGTLLLWVQGSSPSQSHLGWWRGTGPSSGPSLSDTAPQNLVSSKTFLKTFLKRVPKSLQEIGPIGTWDINPTPGVWEDRDWITSSKFWGISLTYTAAVTKQMVEFKLVINFKGVVQLLVLCGQLEDRQKFLSNALGQKKQVLLPNLFSSYNHPMLCHQNDNVLKHFFVWSVVCGWKVIKSLQTQG